LCILAHIRDLCVSMFNGSCDLLSSPSIALNSGDGEPDPVALLQYHIYYIFFIADFLSTIYIYEIYFNDFSFSVQE